MPRFHFPLQRVLDWRAKQCDLEETLLATCLASVRETESKIARVRAERNAIAAQMLNQPLIAAAELVHWNRYRLRAIQQDAELSAELRSRVDSANKQRNCVLEAQRRLKLLEKLKERRRAEYSAGAEKELAELAADSYLAGWGRNAQR